MNSDFQTGPSPHPGKKKRRRDRNNVGDPNLANRGKPISEKWKPVWIWLQSLERREVVESGEILAWLDNNPGYASEIRKQHTPGVLVAYVQKCHQRLISGRYTKIEDSKGRGSPSELPTNVQLPRGLYDLKAVKNGSEVRKDLHQVQWSQQVVQNPMLVPKAAIYEHGDDKLDEASVLDAQTWREQWQTLLDIKKSDSECPAQVEVDTEVPVERQHQGASPYPKRFKQPRSYYSPEPPEKVVLTHRDKVSNVEPLDEMDTISRFELIVNLEMRLKEIVSKCKEQTTEAYATSRTEKHKQVGAHDTGKKSREDSNTPVNAWAFSEATTDLTAGNGNVAPSVVEFLTEREQGANSGAVAYRPNEIGSRGKRWTTVLNGWDSLGKQRLGPTNWLQNRAYSSWVPSWCAYTSSSAIAHPLGGARTDQGIQKVLDVRFHPGGDPLLVVSCNEPPNELMLYSLESGRGKQLIGHNTQIQAVEFALGGESVLSCASNIVKVWDSSSGACQHTLGPGSDDGSVGHKKKISAMTVNQLQPCLAATSGGEGDNQILLWNVQSGQLASDLNLGYRREETDLLSMDALKFCNEKYLICGSDSPGGKPAIVQIWDIDATTNLSTFPAHDTNSSDVFQTFVDKNLLKEVRLLVKHYNPSRGAMQYITCLETNGSTIITGAGDGSVGLFDMRTGGSIARLPLSSSWEVTSVSFSACATYFQASCTGNCTFIWDTRMMPLESGSKCVEHPPPLAQEKTFRALHHLSHGDPMPTSDNSFQVPGYVDNGDQGVNDARWFQGEAILVTASGTGSLTMWDPTLGQPCVQQITSHSRCINTVAVSPKDQFICTGGDDQKVVLYQNVQDRSCPHWRLTHPLYDSVISSAG